MIVAEIGGIVSMQLLPYNGNLYKASVRGTTMDILTVIMTNGKIKSTNRTYKNMRTISPWRLIIQGVPRDGEVDPAVVNMMVSIDEAYGEVM